jgi:two-component system chemotaxis response regulator CheB
MSQKPEVIVIGGSAGSVRVVSKILGLLSPDFHLPILMALHRKPDKDDGGMGLAGLFKSYYRHHLSEPDGQTEILRNTLYLAPADLHMIVAAKGRIESVHSPLVQYSRPSIDVLMLSAAESYGKGVLGIMLTGANSDGALGMQAIAEAGGQTLIQDPKEATIPFMPESALELVPDSPVADLKGIVEFLNGLV